MRKTGFFFDEKCLWHSGGNYALTAPVGGLVQPLAAGGLPENPETKRRLKNLMEVTGLMSQLHRVTSPMATNQQLRRIHSANYLNSFKELSDSGGGEIGLRTPFGAGGYEIAALSAGLVIGALESVLDGRFDNAYALSRPPGHHCLPEWSNGFCLMANIAIAIENAKAGGRAARVAVVDWDVHHGNGTETIFYDRDDVLTISIHQENNYPLDSGAAKDAGVGAGLRYNMNIPLAPGAGHDSYVYCLEQLVLPRLKIYRPDVIIIACGFDASGVDPLSRMLCSAETFRIMTKLVKLSADELCGGKLVMAHEGGYSEVHVPFCGHAVIQEMSDSDIDAGDPLGTRLSGQQPSLEMREIYKKTLDSYRYIFEI